MTVIPFVRFLFCLHPKITLSLSRKWQLAYSRWHRTGLQISKRCRRLSTPCRWATFAGRWFGSRRESTGSRCTFPRPRISSLSPLSALRTPCLPGTTLPPELITTKYAPSLLFVFFPQIPFLGMCQNCLFLKCSRLLG